jgi:folate-binding protein YgfZ
MQCLRDRQQAAGALWHDPTHPSVVTTFGNDQAANAAVQAGVALCDRSHWGCLQVCDQDRLIFLHNQSSNDFKRLQPGQGCETVVLTSTARTLDLVSAYVTEEAVLLLVSPSRCQQLLQWFDLYIFFGDRVQLTDLSPSTAVFSLLGPQSQSLLQKLGDSPLPEALDHHTCINLGSHQVRVAVGGGFAGPGYTILAPLEAATELWDRCIEEGAVPMGEQSWEQIRIQQGRPKADAELTEEYNPLEAGLWQTISLDKGCYIGQETIARLHTYQGVKQHLWGLELSSTVPVGAEISVEDRKVGKVTSVINTPNGVLGLGYVKTKAGGAGLTVQVGEATATLSDLPFLIRSPQNA